MCAAALATQCLMLVACPCMFGWPYIALPPAPPSLSFCPSSLHTLLLPAPSFSIGTSLQFSPGTYQAGYRVMIYAPLPQSLWAFLQVSPPSFPPPPPNGSHCSHLHVRTFLQVSRTTVRCRSLLPLAAVPFSHSSMTWLADKFESWASLPKEPVVFSTPLHQLLFLSNVPPTPLTHAPPLPFILPPPSLMRPPSPSSYSR